MAVGVQFANLIARKTAVDAHHPGGLDHFAAEQINYIEDDHLLRVGTMATASIADIMDSLLEDGVHPDDMAIVQATTDVPDWLERGRLNGRAAVWLAGHDQGQLIPCDAPWLARTTTVTLEGALIFITDAGGTVARRDDRYGWPNLWEVELDGAFAELRATIDESGIGAASLTRRQERRRTILEDQDLCDWMTPMLWVIC